MAELRSRSPQPRFLRTLYLVSFGYRRSVIQGQPFNEWGFIRPAAYYRETAAAARAALRR